MYYRYINLSHNKISLDVKQQQDIFNEIFSNLNQLMILSISGNSFEDKGMELVYNVINNSLFNLQVLDISKCCLTYHSLSYIQDLIYLENIKQIWIQENILANDHIKTIKIPLSSEESMNSKTVDLVFEGKYKGITIGPKDLYYTSRY